MPSYNLNDPMGNLITTFNTVTVLPVGVHNMRDMGANTYQLLDAKAISAVQFVANVPLTQGPVAIVNAI